MKYYESETIELKQKIVDDIKKEVIAFANSQGGTIYIGVNDEGQVLGMENVDFSIQQIGNMVRDSIKPDVTMFIHYDRIEDSGKTIIAVRVQRGTKRPYYLAKKGLKSEGVYIRQGTASVPATDTAIRQMIKETDGDRYEELRSTEQDLSFLILKEEFIQRGLKLEEPQMRTMKLKNPSGLYTNLALLLSDQCPHTIKAAVFEGEKREVFKDRREFTGSLLKQLKDVYDYVDLNNRTQATFEKLLRIDVRDYPEEALREALLNLIVHREYSLSASSLINIYSDRIEMVSIGGLVPGISLDDIKMGISICRNQNLANVFYRLQLVEAYGTGISKIMNAYESATQKPQIEVSTNAFKIVLPNINYSEHVERIPLAESTTSKDETEIKILSYVEKHGSASRAEIQELLKVSVSSANRLIQALVRKGILKREGAGKNTRYLKQLE